MSFILDALRKSENSRLRQDHPAVFSHRPVAERKRLPIWGVVLIALLAINLLIVLFLFLRETTAVTVRPAPAVAPATTSSVTATVAPTADTVAPMPPAPIAPPASMPTPDGNFSRAAGNLATRDELLARGASLPSTDLNMHVYDANPSLRFILLNGQRLREGESSREGLLVDRITPEGVVLRYDNSAFAITLQ
jgi:hypothetical protein